jgi:hypothetical protein
MPSEISVTYSCSVELWRQREAVRSFLRDLFYGQSFRVLCDREATVPLTDDGFEDRIMQTEEEHDRKRFSLHVPVEQFEDGSLVSLVNQLWGNALDYGPFRLESLDPMIISSLRPRRRPPLLANMANARRPFLGTILKPSWHLSLKERIHQATRFVSLGGDFVKEDETYCPALGRFVNECREIQAALDSVDTSERGLGVYVPHVSGILGMNNAIAVLQDAGARAAMVSFLTVGMDTVRNLAQGTSLFLWGHRVGYRAFQETLSRAALLQLARATGLNAVHVGTPFVSDAHDLQASQELARLSQDLDRDGTDPMYQVLSKTTGESVGALLQRLGPDIVLLACGEFLGVSSVDETKMQAWLRVARPQLPGCPGDRARAGSGRSGGIEKP